MIRVSLADARIGRRSAWLNLNASSDSPGHCQLLPAYWMPLKRRAQLNHLFYAVFGGHSKPMLWVPIPPILTPGEESRSQCPGYTT